MCPTFRVIEDLGMCWDAMRNQITTAGGRPAYCIPPAHVDSGHPPLTSVTAMYSFTPSQIVPQSAPFSALKTPIFSVSFSGSDSSTSIHSNGIATPN